MANDSKLAEAEARIAALERKLAEEQEKTQQAGLECMLCNLNMVRGANISKRMRLALT